MSWSHTEIVRALHEPIVWEIAALCGVALAMCVWNGYDTLMDWWESR